jgi:hypothetical protein
MPVEKGENGIINEQIRRRLEKIFDRNIPINNCLIVIPGCHPSSSFKMLKQISPKKKRPSK